MKESFVKWCFESQLSYETIVILEDKGFTSKEAFKMDRKI